MDTKNKSAMEAILNGKGTMYRSYQNGWLKALDNYNKLLYGRSTKRKALELKLKRA